MANTIVALATPVGRSGIGVVRLSGPGSVGIVARMIGDGDSELRPRRAHLKQLRDLLTAEVIDQAIVTWYKAPNSFTGEDVVEISCHGSPVLLRQIIDACLELGARMADAGEFSLRALANGRMDLAEAEAIRDLIDAQTAAAARQAVRQLRGEFSHRLQPIKDELLDVIVVLESALEFVEDDLPATASEALRERLMSVSKAIGELAATFRAGHLIRDGIRVAIVGRPNVGKSSLFNALLGSERAIVTDIAGTTRDQLHERLVIDNIPVSLIDTAGLRDTTDTVEIIGVERSRRTMADADLVLALVDGADAIDAEDKAILESLESVPHVIALNKIDIAPRSNVDALAGMLSDGDGQILKLSARTGEGLDELKRAIVEPFSTREVETSGFLVTDARHHDLLSRAKMAVDDAMELLGSGTSEEIILVDLHNALRYLGDITGETTTEDMLTRIFSTFCIGK